MPGAIRRLPPTRSACNVTKVNPAWQPSSAFGWIDVDRDEAKRVRELLGLFKVPEAIDPHGILPLQIALSDRLFPGMSTQHTRARYVFFSAWHAERLSLDTSRRASDASLRLDELALMRSLLEGEDRAGVFGRRSREKTKTLPTAIYWTALQRWNVIPHGLAVHDLRSERRDAASRRANRQASDDAANPARLSGLLPADFPRAPQGFPSADQTISMTREESEYLVERVIASCPRLVSCCRDGESTPLRWPSPLEHRPRSWRSAPDRCTLLQRTDSPRSFDVRATARVRR